MKDEATQPRYAYPGHEAYYEDRTLLYEGRMFVGSCLDKYPNAVVWHQRNRSKSGQLESSILS
jgi:hypothetical protein